MWDGSKKNKKFYHSSCLNEWFFPFFFLSFFTTFTKKGKIYFIDPKFSKWSQDFNACCFKVFLSIWQLSWRLTARIVNRSVAKSSPKVSLCFFASLPFWNEKKRKNGFPLKLVEGFHQNCLSRSLSALNPAHSINYGSTNPYASIVHKISQHSLHFTAKNSKKFSSQKFFCPNVTNSDFFTTGWKIFLNEKRQQQQKFSLRKNR